MNAQQKKYLLNLARSKIAKKLNINFKINENLGKFETQEKRGTFVTLEKKGDLRGCIGNIEPYNLIESIENNAISAAFNDPRFPSLTKEEFFDINIEISILTVPEKLVYKDTKDLLTKLNENLGVIIKKGVYKSATFLPQVWEDVVDKEDFLNHLCLKATLNKDAWKTENLDVYTYKVIHFNEEEFK